MPQGDRTGPRGFGSRTGRQLGSCEGAIPRGYGRGFGRCGREFRGGFGRGWRNVEFTAEQEQKILEAEKAELEAELETIKKQLKKS